MRPVPVTSSPPASRPSTSRADGDAASLLATAPSTNSMSFILASESELDTADVTRSNQYQQGSSRRRRKSPIASSLHQSWSHLSTMSSTSSCSGVEQPVFHHDYMQPPHSHFGGLSGPISAISSTSSRRDSFTASSEFQDSLPPSLIELNAEIETPHPHISSSTLETGPAGPQLIMPSLTVPRRRPFSAAGKAIGKLKILVTGPAGVGKTSIISAIARCCEHIVHIDQVSGPASSGTTEIYASTKPYPWWHSDLESSSSTTRRRSLTDEILDRNVCFVDSSPTVDGPVSTSPEIQYVESHLLPLLEKQVDDRDLPAFLSGGGGSVVDVALYLIPASGLSSFDLDRIKILQNLTNIVPLLTRSDELSSQDVSQSKQHIRKTLEDASIECFSFVDVNSAEESPDIYAVSAATESDHDTIDASVLMSSEYVQPLVTTELSRLVQAIFSLDGSAQLRHASAVKCTRWRREHGSTTNLQFALSSRGSPMQYAISPVLAANPFAQRRQWRRVEMTSWAEALRHSLEMERLGNLARDTLARETILYETSTTMVRRRERRRKVGSSFSTTTHQDPLGLLQLASQVKRHGGVALELLSSLGALGCVAAWVMGSEWAVHRGSARLPEWCLAFC